MYSKYVAIKIIFQRIKEMLNFYYLKTKIGITIKYVPIQFVDMIFWGVFFYIVVQV